MKFTSKEFVRISLQTFLILMIIFCNQNINAVGTPWCFTKPYNNVPGFTPSPGTGLNWGFTPKQTQMVQTTYNVKLITSEIDGSQTKSYVYLKLYGTQGATEMSLVSKGYLEIGSQFDGTILSQRDLGTIYKIAIHIVGETCYRPLRVKINKGSGTEFSFENLRRLCPCKPGGDPTTCHVEIKEEGNVSYDVQVKTRDDEQATYNGPIHVLIRGTNGASEEKIWNEHGAERSSDIVKTILTGDIGEIVGYQFIIKAPGDWKPGLVIIKNNITEINKTFQVSSKATLSFPGRATYQDNFISQGNVLKSFAESEFGGQNYFGSATLNFPSNYNVSLPGGGGFVGDNLADAYKLNNLMKMPKISGPEGRTQVGSVTSAEEKKQIIELTCEQNLMNPSSENQMWGADYAGGNANFGTRLVKCPLNCDKLTAPVFGVGIHPAKTNVCLAGIVDKAISPYGGLMAVNMYPAVMKYIVPSGWKTVGNIQLKSYYEQTEKSFTVTKVDNIDMVDKDIRIVDATGNISNEGRVEFRYQGYWGSLCFKGVNEFAAIRLCKDLDFLWGTWKNPQDKSSEGFCRSHNGQNYCGSDYTRVFFSQLACQESTQSFNDCDKIFASPRDCTHAFDSILSCTNEDMKAHAMTGSDSIKPFTVRMKNNRRIENEEIGALELFTRQEWSTVCDINFSNESADVACRQMGFGKGRWYNSEDASNWKQSAEDMSNFAATKLECSGTENNLANCSSQTDKIQCTHNHDVVVACSNGKGDPSGESQIHPKVVNPPPDLGRLGMVSYTIDCDTTFQKRKYFRGDPGSAWIVECPGACDKKRGSVIGTGVYASDSNICLSACHAGVIPCETGGQMVITKTFGQEYYEGSDSNGIVSTMREGTDTVASFTFTKKFSNFNVYNSILTSNNLAEVSHVNKSWSNYYEKLLNKANQGLTNLFSLNKGSPQEQMENHGTQQASLNADLNISKLSLNASLDVGGGGLTLGGGLDVGGANISGSLSLVSFLELSSKSGLEQNYSSGSQFGPVAYKWIESIGTHRFDEFGKIVVNASPIKTLEKEYTIFMSFTLQEWRFDEAYILSYSGCEGFNIWINMMNTLILGDPCNPNYQLNTGWKIPLNVKSILWVYYSQKKVKLKFRVIKDPDFYQQDKRMRLIIPEKQKLCLGCKASDETKFFVGDIDFILIYESFVPHTMINNVIDEIDNQKKSQDNVNNFPTTTDGRKCLSNPTTDPTPLQPGAPTPPEAAIQKRPDEAGDPANTSDGGNVPKKDPSDVDEGHPNKIAFLEHKTSGFFNKLGQKIKGWLFGKDQSKSNKPTPPPSSTDDKNSESPAESTMNKDEEGNLSSVLLECDDTGVDKRFANQKGKIFRITCGSCWNARYAVFGSGIYHPNSSICRSAIHSGVLAKGEKGDIILEIGQGFPAYNGEPGLGGVKSISAGSEEYSLLIRKAPPLRVVTCTTTATEDEFGTSAKNTKFLVVCPKHCAKSTKNVYGSGTYSESSPICMSAYHDGIIGDQGGNVQFIISDGLTEYKGTQGFSIKSQALGPQLRSFTFLGSKSSIFHNFSEKCDGLIKNHWKQIDDKNTIYQNENAWSFYKNPNWLNGNKKVEPLKTIMHYGKIKNKNPGMTYATILKYSYQGSEWANGLIRVNMMFFGKEGKAGIMFRYVDNDNHYGLIFDLEDNNNNLKLYKKSEGSIDVVAGKFIDVSLALWYRVSIYLDYNNVRVTLQIGDIRQHKEIFNKPIKGIQRGTMAIGVDKMRRIFFMGVEVSNWSPNNIRNSEKKVARCVVDQIQNSINIDKRKYACRRMFRTNPSEMIRCLEPHVFCKYKCDEFISPIEAISNFCCFNTCVQSIKNLTKTGIMMDSTWEPIVGEKVDYLQRGENGYIAARVTAVQDEPEYGEGAKLISINYVSPDGVESNGQERWKPHAKSIVKCGQELSARKDCGATRHFG